MILMRLIHIEKRLERLLGVRPKRHRTATERRGYNKTKVRKRKGTRS
jgi:hypothetical protein